MPQHMGRPVETDHTISVLQKVGGQLARTAPKIQHVAVQGAGPGLLVKPSDLRSQSSSKAIGTILDDAVSESGDNAIRPVAKVVRAGCHVNPDRGTSVSGLTTVLATSGSIITKP
jgi:hypothetical protein